LSARPVPTSIGTTPCALPFLHLRLERGCQRRRKHERRAADSVPAPGCPPARARGGEEASSSCRIRPRRHSSGVTSASYGGEAGPREAPRLRAQR
jgi:hypothetical protein